MVYQNKIFSFKIKRKAKSVFPSDVERADGEIRCAMVDMAPINDTSGLLREKATFGQVRQTKTQIKLRPAQSDQSLHCPYDLRNFVSLVIQNAASDDSDQTARTRRLI